MTRFGRSIRDLILLPALLLLASVPVVRGDCPAGIPASVQYTVSSTDTLGTETTYFEVTVSGGTALDGIHDAWCLVENADVDSSSKTTYTAAPICSTTSLSGVVDRPENLDQVNWILNQHLTTLAGGDYSYVAVQHAIWKLLNATYDQGNISTRLVAQRDAIIGLASAHAGYVPGCGELAGIVLPGVDALGTPAQPLLIGVPVACLGDFVWVDANANGAQDAGEVGKAGVLVQLFDCSGNYLAQTLTDENGLYHFYVAPGSYSVVFSLPGGYVFTTQGPLGVRDETDSDADTASGQTECFPVAASQVDLSWDAGLVPLGSIGDRVWEDLKGDGIQDASEPGVPDVLIELRSCADYSLVASTVTDASGYYLFPNLPAGDYYVVFAKPDGFSFTTYKAGLDDTTDSDADLTTGATACVALGWGESNLDVDAGLLGSSLISGDTATIGYWQNKNGQALIKSLNGGPTSTALANWLASNFPYLYGPYSANDLTGKSNADVAALFVKFFKVKGTKTNAQVLAAALAVYVTDYALAGNAAVSAGFNVSATGTGFRVFNVGSCGAAAGLDNNTTYSVGYLLWVANYQKQNGSFDANAFNCIFDGINRAGDRL